jgi:hypothetical protein
MAIRDEHVARSGLQDLDEFRGLPRSRDHLDAGELE